MSAKSKIDTAIFKNKINNNECNGQVSKCKQTQRILDALLHYQELSAYGNPNTLVKFCSQTYKYLIEDYSHIMIYHNNNDDIEFINNLIFTDKKYVALSKCDPGQCQCSVRNRRNRGTDNDKTKSTNVDSIFWRDFLDQIHAFLVHTFQFGGRIKKNDYSINEQDEKKANDEDVSCVDKSFNLLRKVVEARKEIFERIDSAKGQSTKFNITANNNDNAITDNDEEKTNPKKATSSAFSIGITWYYWDYYKAKKEIEQATSWDGQNENDHLGYNYQDLFVKKKYKHLKQEVLNNKQHSIALDSFAQILKKATQYMIVDKVRNIPLSRWDGGSGGLHYGIKKGSAFTMDHLTSILLYTDFTVLSRTFTSTFRLFKDELISDAKQRNAEYANWSRLFRETVQYFGTKLEKERKQPFFCGMTKLLIPSFVIRLCGPTSTTKQLGCALRFANNKGIILAVNNGGNYQSQFLRHFDVSYLSCFSDEDERIFCGGVYPLRLETVRLVADNVNLYVFLKPLFFFDCMVSGIELASGLNAGKSRSLKIISVLISKQNKFLKYVNDTFTAFCENKTQIAINMHLINEQFKLLSSSIFVSSSPHLLDIVLIAKLFVNCKHVIIYDDSASYNTSYPFDLIAFVSEATKIIESATNNLSQITVKVKKSGNYFDGYKDSWMLTSYSNSDVATKVKSSKVEITTKVQDKVWDVLFLSVVS
eukprot:236476_1